MRRKKRRKKEKKKKEKEEKRRKSWLYGTSLCTDIYLFQADMFCFRKEKELETSVFRIYAGAGCQVV